MVKEVIILAGGLGTRLREAVPDLPKCMAPILAKPFVGYLVDYLQQQGVQSYIFSLGYKFAVVEQYLRTQYGHLDLVFSVETEPLGTGGAIRLACAHVTEKTVVVLNGDTFFKVNLNQLLQLHAASKADCSLSLKAMKHFDRYGVVTLNNDHSINSFHEKKFYEEGLINGGVYALDLFSFMKQSLPEKFSFEKDYLEKFVGSGRLYGSIHDAYFIDIGIPEDFERAQTELITNTLPDV